MEEGGKRKKRQSDIRIENQSGLTRQIKYWKLTETYTRGKCVKIT